MIPVGVGSFMKRRVRIKFEYVMEIDDDGVGLPELGIGSATDAARLLAPTGEVVLGTVKLACGLTRESSAAIRKEAKAAKALSESVAKGADAMMRPDRSEIGDPIEE